MNGKNEGGHSLDKVLVMECDEKVGDWIWFLPCAVGGLNYLGTLLYSHDETIGDTHQACIST